MASAFDRRRVGLPPTPRLLRCSSSSCARKKLWHPGYPHVMKHFSFNSFPEKKKEKEKKERKTKTREMSNFLVQYFIPPVTQRYTIKTGRRTLLCLSPISHKPPLRKTTEKSGINSSPSMKLLRKIGLSLAWYFRSFACVRTFPIYTSFLLQSSKFRFLQGND